MRALFAAVLLSVMVGLPVAANAQGHTAAPTPAHRSQTLGKDAATLAGGVLGLVVASGIVGVVNAGTLAFSGTAIVDALEAGANLTLPMALLGAGLGAVFGQETVLRNINWLIGGEAAKGGH